MRITMFQTDYYLLAYKMSNENSTSNELVKYGCRTFINNAIFLNSRLLQSQEVVYVTNYWSSCFHEYKQACLSLKGHECKFHLYVKQFEKNITKVDNYKTRDFLWSEITVFSVIRCNRNIMRTKSLRLNAYCTRK